jgi:acylphosphatase
VSDSEPAEERPCRRRVIFYGRVQGVGFRYTTASIAKRYHIEGYVRNQPDGAVELVAEGTVHRLERLLKDISAEFAGNIERQDAEEIPMMELFAGFEIRR